MARHIRHIHAGPNEWVRVHRNRRGGGGGDTGCGMLILIALAILFFRGC
jgi:hypothetical protein